jgi:hypothetical protein
VVSRYVNGTAGWLVTLAILAMGAASAVLLGLLRGVRGHGAGWRAGRWALAVWTAGVLVAGVFWLGLAGLAATSRCGKIAGCCDSPISSSTARTR